MLSVRTAGDTTVKQVRKRKNEDCDQCAIDNRKIAMLALSRYCQEEWVRSMIRLHMRRGRAMEIALLSGDAGCGKSYAISLLVAKLTEMNVSVAVSALTNKAAGTLAELSCMKDVCTLHKLMGFRKELLDDKLTLDRFLDTYREVHFGTLTKFKKLYESQLSTEHENVRKRHSCITVSPESCATCSKMFQRLRIPTKSCPQAPMEEAPPFLGVNVIVVDEYGLMTAELFKRMMCCIELFYGPGKGPLIIFSGSVSQLQPVGSSPRIWQDASFETALSHCTPLFVNRRQFEDPEYAEAVTYLQFNTVTEQSRRIFVSQTRVSERDAMNPAYHPEMLRIFHQDKQQRDYTAAYIAHYTKDVRTGERFLSVTRNGFSRRGPNAWYDVLKQAAQALPKLFSLPPYRSGVRPVERDYLTVDRLWIGCRVRLIWHMDSNGIHIASGRKMGPSGSKESLAYANEGKVNDTEGVIVDIKFKAGQKFNEFYVKGAQSGAIYRVGPSQWNCHNWIVTTHPLACLLAMNTYDCQGCTVRGQVLYHPPKHFAISPIKPSVYVVLTRVVNRENLQMTNCNFANRVGHVQFYDEKLVLYRKRVEMSYLQRDIS